MPAAHSLSAIRYSPGSVPARDVEAARFRAVGEGSGTIPVLPCASQEYYHLYN